MRFLHRLQQRLPEDFAPFKLVFLLLFYLCAIQLVSIWSTRNSIGDLPKERFTEQRLLKSGKIANISSSPTLRDYDTRLEHHANAAIVSLCRNQELQALLQTLSVFEKRFNQRFGYPYIFLNDQPFSDHFKQQVTQLLNSFRSNASVEFGLVPEAHWQVPEWINRTRMQDSLGYMQSQSIPYGGSESYRHMCRYQSGFFFQHPLLESYDYYWRIEPETQLLCDVIEDPFLEMIQKRAKYGFTMSFLEFGGTISSLWWSTLTFAQEWKAKHNPDFNPSLLGFFESYSGDYNLCHFWSNFEIGSLDFLRSNEYTEYFQYLDRTGGFVKVEVLLKS